MKTRTEALESIPSLFQYIWVGGSIKADDLTQICELSTTSRDSHFKTIIWTDDEKHIQKTLERIDLATSIYQEKRFNHRARLRDPNTNHPNSAASLGIEVNAKNFNIEVKHINELLQLLKTDPIFSEEETNELIFNIMREAIGHQNLASVSDLIRYCSLYYFGGYYLDTELRAEISHELLQADKPPLGIIGNFSTTLTALEAFKRDLRLPYEEKYEICGNNDAYGVIPRHPVLRIAIKKALNFYKTLDGDPIILNKLNVYNIERVNGIPLSIFDKAFIEKLSLDENQLLKATFINSILEISFNLRLLKNTKTHTEQEINDIQKKQTVLMKSLKDLVVKTSYELGLNPKTYNTSTSKNIFVVFKNWATSHTVATELSEKLLKLIDSEVRAHQEQYGFGYEKATEMDAKRYPFQQGITETRSKRRKHTVQAAVNSLCDAITEFLNYDDDKENSVYTAEEMARFPTETLTHENFRANTLKLAVSQGTIDSIIMMAGCLIKMEYANSWLRVNKGEKKSFDDSVLPSKTKHSFFNTEPHKVSKEEADIESNARAVTNKY